MNNYPKAIRDAAEKLTRELFDQGKIIEGGWQGLRLMAIPPAAPQLQIDEMRMAFFAGAAHLMASIMNVLDPQEEPTERDLRRMTQIHRELKEFETQFVLRHTPAAGAG